MDDTEPSWCSWCYQKATHKKLIEADLGGIRRAIYECSHCGGPTAACRTPRCTKMACAGDDVSHQLCATHRGEISSFEAQSALIADPRDFELLFKVHDGDPNIRYLVKRGVVVVAAVAATVPAAKAGAAVAAGIYGSRVLGFSGVVAKAAALAQWGGGALSAGGGGMALGLKRAAFLFALNGARKGWGLANTYFNELADQLQIEKIREGHDPALICIDGFLTQTWNDTETEENNQAWLDGLGDRYEGHAIYRVRWPSKHVRDVGKAGFSAAVGGAVPRVLAHAVSRASKAAADTLSSLPAAMAGAGLAAAANPWSVALSNSKKVGFLLAEMIARCDSRSFIIIGHSLGARASVFALRRLAKRHAGSTKSSVVAVHLMGGAIDRRDAAFWAPVCKVVQGRLVNYYTTNDQALGAPFQIATAQVRGEAIGRCAIPTNDLTAVKIMSVDVGPFGVGGHREYHRNMARFLQT